MVLFGQSCPLPCLSNHTSYAYCHRVLHVLKYHANWIIDYMAWGRSLLFKHENLSSDPQYWCKNLVWWCMPVTPLLRGGGGGRIDEACWPSSLTKISSSKLSEWACLKNAQWSVTGEVIRCGSLASTHTGIDMFACALMCTHPHTEL